MAKSDNPFGLKVDLEGNLVTVTVREKDSNGDFSDVDVKEFNIDEVHADLLSWVALYGLSKLLQDRSSDVKAGPDKLDAMTEVFEQLKAGQKERERKAGAPTVSAEVMALADIKGVCVADIQKALRAYSKEVREKILSNPAVVERAAAMRSKTTEVALDDLV